MKNKKITKYKSKEIIRYNKLIAKFMGEKFFIADVYDNFDRKTGTERKVKFSEMLVGSDWSRYSNAHNENELCYHLHWDWLMPVVDKIQEIGANMEIKHKHSYIYWWYSTRKTNFDWREPRKPFDAIGGKHYSRSVGIGETGEKVNAETKIESVYNNVVYFIKWYSKTVKNKK